MESSCLTKSPSSSSDLRTLSILLFSFCLTFPSSSIILFRGTLVYPLISGNIRQPKMEPFLRQYSQNRICYVVYRVTGSSRNKPSPRPDGVSGRAPGEGAEGSPGRGTRHFTLHYTCYKPNGSDTLNIFVWQGSVFPPFLLDFKQ